MYKVGLSTVGKRICEELFLKYQKAGLKAMEIRVPAGQHLLLDYKEVFTLAEKYDIKLWSYHLPYYPFDEVDIANKEIQKKTIHYFSEIIKRGSEIGIDKFIVHPSGAPIMEQEREEKKNIAKESLFSLADIAEKNGAVLAVENLTRYCIGRNSEEMLELMEVSPKLRICFDTNHLFGEKAGNFLRKVGDRVITLHVSDNDFIEERHWLPGEGKQDWKEILKALNDINYSGIWMYEIGFKCPDTIVRNRDFVCEDFVRNAEELFAGKKLTIIT